MHNVRAGTAGRMLGLILQQRESGTARWAECWGAGISLWTRGLRSVECTMVRHPTKRTERRSIASRPTDLATPTHHWLVASFKICAIRLQRTFRVQRRVQTRVLI